jgi:hypothetical protein
MTTIKTIKLKRNPESAPAVAPLDAETTVAAQPDEAPRAAPIGLEQASSAPSGKRSSFTLFAIFGLCATIALLAVIGLQAAEWTFYAASPSVWTVK